MSVVADPPKISILSGTPKQVQTHLAKSEANRVLAFVFERIKPSDFQVLADNLTHVTSSMYEVLLERHDQKTLERLAEILLPRSPPSPRLLKEAAMLVRARKAVLENGDWLTSADIAQLAGLSTRNPSAQPNKWKKRGLIFAINQGGVDYFPGYGLDRHASFRPLKALAEVIEIFAGRKDGWGMACWFSSSNSCLRGKRPQDLLASAPKRVIEAAIDEIQGITHG